MINARFFPDPLSFRRGLTVALVFATMSAGAQAAEAGRIVLVHGSAQVAQRAVAVGQSVAEGDEIATGKDGYVYLRTIDNGLLILRPSSRARIVTYHIDSKNPANTRIKLELLSGVARSVSGEAVKLARQNFRFNTPVAAIGVRGTDFTVYTDSNTSRVTVLTGGIVVSGFGGSCSPDGAGPCEHATSRELFANQVGQMLQIARGTAMPQLISVTPALAPDTVAPPRRDEPQAKAEAPMPPARMELGLDAQKAGNILRENNAPVVTKPTPPVVLIPPTPPSVPEAPQANPLPLPELSPPLVEQPPAPPELLPPVPVPVPDPSPVPPVPPLPVEPVVPPPPVKTPQLVWGRWQPVANKPAQVDAAKVIAEGGQRVAQNSIFTVMRTAGTWLAPTEGTVGFKLMQSDAQIRNELTNAISAAGLENGKLNLDFGAAKFSTSFDLVVGSERFQLQAQGLIGTDGALSGNSQSMRPTNMYVNGAVTPENGLSAAYLFNSRIDMKRIATGITYWNKQ